MRIRLGGGVGGAFVRSLVSRPRLGEGLGAMVGVHSSNQTVAVCGRGVVVVVVVGHVESGREGVVVVLSSWNCYVLLLGLVMVLSVTKRTPV